MGRAMLSVSNMMLDLLPTPFQAAIAGTNRAGFADTRCPVLEANHWFA
jgi:hypothetical protein